jgi:hypothetical protein
VHEGLAHTCDMKREVVLDLKALRAHSDHSPHIEQQLLLLFMGTAERCLVRMQGLVVHGDHRQWQSIVRELKGASAHIHAKELAILCKHAVNAADDSVSRIDAYLQIKEAYEGLLIYVRTENLLMHAAAQGGF